MGNSASAFGWTRRRLLSIPGAAAISGCALGSRPRVIFIGDGPSKEFLPWRQFRDAVMSQQASLLDKADLHYLQCPKLDHARKRQLIRSEAQQSATVLVAPSGNSAAMAVEVAPRTPVVFASFLDPVRAGFVLSNRVPGAMATGVSLADRLDGKRLQLLQQAFPEIRRVGILTDRSWQQHYDGESRVLAEASALGLQVQLHIGETADDIGPLMGSARAARHQAWYVMPTDLAYVGESRIKSNLRRLGVPAMYSTLGEVERGGELAYAADASFVYPTLAELVKRIVDGESPGRIPIERPRRFLLIARSDARWHTQPINARLLQRANVIF
ncbi:hypothetical protein EXH46_16305 [Pelomonas puraquae]|uniref:ABC transporter substrate-binding protein n=1 Tax=Roseateles puraquae TaxID=431059 RepID=A0A254N5V3_9BURK|nr:hypothetical protein [Roseateles puraquae]MDG0855330.1 hypothetical protein [Roseateles puraquae]OWR01757.1 hypothetical protein CDO81_23625 [Roseateles puraquae]